MARYRMTILLDAGHGSVPGQDVVDDLPLPGAVTALSSSWEGSRLRVVLDFRSSKPATVCRRSVDAVRGAWAERTGAPAPAPGVTLRPLRAPQPTLPPVERPREYAWVPDGGQDGHLVLVDKGSEPITAPLPPAAAGSGPAAQTGPQPRRRPTPGLGSFRLGLPTLPRRTPRP